MNEPRITRAGTIMLTLAVWCCFAVTSLPAAEDDLPEVKFFFFDGKDVEWVVSAEPQAFERHLSDNATSRTLLTTLQSAIDRQVNPDEMRPQMARWVEGQRRSFERGSIANKTYQRAEGIVAYLRAHDFSIPKLVAALKQRSGASSVVIAAIHQTNGDSNARFKLKVMLEDAHLDLGQMGYNVDLPSPDVGYITVIYALGFALYEVHELLSVEVPPAPPEEEQLPDPDAALETQGG